MILDDGFRLRGPNHHRVENLWPQYRDASHNRHHDDQRLSGPQRATGWLTVPAVGRCCHRGGWQSSSFSGTSETDSTVFTLTFFPAFLIIDSTPCGEEMPFASRSLVNAFLAKKTFSFHLYVCRLANCRKIPATQPQAFRQFSLNFSFSRTTDRND